MKKLILFCLFLIFVSCDKKSPRQKTKDYIWYLDAFYFELSEDQEKMLKQIVDFYFDETTKVNALNKDIYTNVLFSLEKNAESLPIASIEQSIYQRRDRQKFIIKKLLDKINLFYQSLNKDQKTDLAKKIKELKNKSSRFKYILGEEI